jgi:hypothetical protein
MTAQRFPRRLTLAYWPLLLAAVAVAAASLAACGSGSSGGEASAASGSPGATTPSGAQVASPSPAATYTNADWYRVTSNPNGFKGQAVELTGKIFAEPEYDQSGVGFQMWADPQRSEGNTIVWLPDPTVELRTDDYVRVSGVITGSFTGENMMGGEVQAAMIQAGTVEKVGALAAAPPAIEIVDVNQGATQHGITVKLRRVEFAEAETRVFVTFINQSNSKASIYAYSAKAIQGGRTYSPEMGLQGYPEPESELPRSTRTSGVVVFKAMKPEKTTRFIFEGYSDDWTKTLKPFSIVVK